MATQTIITYAIDITTATIVDADMSAPIPLESGVTVVPGRIRVDQVKVDDPKVVDACFITRDEITYSPSGATFTVAGGIRTYRFNWGIDTPLGMCVLRLTEIVKGTDDGVGSRSEGSSMDFDVAIGEV